MISFVGSIVVKVHVFPFYTLPVSWIDTVCARVASCFTAPIGASDRPLLQILYDSEPVFNSKEWWACIVHEKMRNLDTAQKRHNTDPMAVPQDLTGLQEYSTADVRTEVDEDAAKRYVPDDDSSGNSDCGDPNIAADEEGVSGDGAAKRKRQNALRASPLSVFCGKLPDGKRLGDFHSPPAGKIHHKSVESIYWQEFGKRLESVFKSDDQPKDVVGADDVGWCLSGAEAAAACDRQNKFFKDVDKYLIADMPGITHTACRVDLDEQIQLAVGKMSTPYTRSPTLSWRQPFSC